MNLIVTRLSLVGVFTSLVALQFSHNACAQGSLTPPGAPAPTMKSLAQIEPRTPISSIPITISNAGSYYLTTNLVGTSGITVTADGVTLDLAGFSLIGQGGGGAAGIAASVVANLTVRNGIIRSWPGSGISGSPRDAVFSNLSFIANGSTAITGGANCQVRNCTAAQNTGGIVLGQGSVVADSIIRNNSSTGILVGEASSIVNCTVFNNSVHGIILGNASSVEGCNVKTNLQNGIVGNDANRITRCVVSQNLSNGVSMNFSARITDCVVSSNKVDGIRVSARSTISGNLCDFNGTSGTQAGIHLVSSDNRVEDNNLTSNIAGLRSDAGFNVIVRNKATLNTVNFSLAGLEVGTFSTTNAATASPWANFAY